MIHIKTCSRVRHLASGVSFHLMKPASIEADKCFCAQIKPARDFGLQSLGQILHARNPNCERLHFQIPFSERPSVSKENANGAQRKQMFSEVALARPFREMRWKFCSAEKRSCTIRPAPRFFFFKHTTAAFYCSTLCYFSTLLELEETEIRALF